jgi:hypothetical protein
MPRTPLTIDIPDNDAPQDFDSLSDFIRNNKCVSLNKALDGFLRSIHSRLHFLYRAIDVEYLDDYGQAGLAYTLEEYASDTLEIIVFLNSPAARAQCEDECGEFFSGDDEEWETDRILCRHLEFRYEEEETPAAAQEGVPQPECPRLVEFIRRGGMASPEQAMSAYLDRLHSQVVFTHRVLQGIRKQGENGVILSGLVENLGDLARDVYLVRLCVSYPPSRKRYAAACAEWRLTA